MLNGYLTKVVKTIIVQEPKNMTGAALAASHMSMKGYSKVRFVITTGAWAAGTAAVTLAQATTVAGGSTKALGFTKMWTATKAAGTLTETAVAANTFNLAAADTLYIIEVAAPELDVDGGFDCIAIAVASPGANADYYNINAEFYGGRYQDEDGLSPLAD